jgi:hypothetical protein
MDARIVRVIVMMASIASLGAGYRTPNFVVEASNEGLAQRVGLAAEKYRRELAVLWLGEEFPDWNDPCPITVQVAPHLGAGGETSFVFDRGQVFGWRMRVQGSEERVLDSVLPHEVTHTILATHFRRPLPRWADEGACTTVEHQSERSKQQMNLVTFLRTNKGIAFSQMFTMKEYPPDMLPLYAQGYSLARYLIQQGGRQKFVAYIGEGLKRENWRAATKTYYGYDSLAQLQNAWLDWVKQGSPAESPVSPDGSLLLAQNDASRAPSRDDAQARARFQSPDRGISTFENNRPSPRDDNRTSAASIAGVPAADRGTASVTATRTGKQSVYERGIEPSGNPQKYPFKVATSRMASESRQLPETTTGDAAGKNSAVPAADMASRSAASRRVILEWSRDENHKRLADQPTADTSW